MNRIDTFERDIAQAWWIGARVGQAFAGKLPSLKQVFAESRQQAAIGTGQRQTVAQQRTVLHMISEAYNLPLRTSKRRRRAA